MTVYGFNRKTTALALSEIGRQQPPDAYARGDRNTPLMHFVCLTPSGGISGRSGSTLGKAKCDIFSIDSSEALRNIRVNRPPGSTPVNIVNLDVDVFNLSTADVAGNEYRIVHEVSGRWVVEAGGGGGSDFGYVRFKTTAKITNRQVTAVIEYVISNQTNPATGQPFDVGDTITVNDSRNLFPDIEAGGTGTAYWYDVPDATPTPIARWEVEDCSLPINEVLVKLESCLYKSTANHFGVFGPANGITHWIRSDANNVDFPPEAVERSANDYVLDFSNNMGLDAVTGQFVVCRRIAEGSLPSDPSNDTVPKPGSNTSVYWQAIKVYDTIARWICVERTGVSQYTLLDFWEGQDPRICGTFTVTENCLTSRCDDDQSNFICCYDPENNTYIPVSSESALLGKPTVRNIITGPPTVSTDPAKCEADQYCWEWPTEPLVTFDCAEENPEGTPPIPQCIDGKDLLDCIDLCEYICTYCEPYANDPDCGSPCYGNCDWRWDEAGNQWVQIKNDCEGLGCLCPSPPATDGDFDGQVVSLPCEAVPAQECCGNVSGDEEAFIATQVQFEIGADTFTATGNGGTVTQGSACGLAFDLPVTIQRLFPPEQYAGHIRGTLIPAEGCNPPCVWKVTISFDGDEFADVLYDAPGKCKQIDPKGPWDCAASNPNNVDGLIEIQDEDMSLNEDCVVQPAAARATSSVSIGGTVPDLTKLGQYFYHANRELFATSCTRDFVALLDRAGENLTPQTIARVVNGLARKTRLLTKAQIENRLTNAHASWLDGKNS